MNHEREPQTFVVEYQDAKERDKGVAEMTRQGYGVLTVVPFAGTPKKSKVGGADSPLPTAGARRSECYRVTFTEIQ